MKKEERISIYKALSAAFPPEAIERSNGVDTGRGYDTTGIRCQWIVDRLNEVLGVGGHHVQRKTKVTEFKRSNGRPGFEASCDLTLQLGEWIQGTFVPFAEAVAYGGHIANSEADALKGAHSNALKRAAAFLGCGVEAYLGTIDDDNVPELTAPRRGPTPRPAKRSSTGTPGDRPAQGPPPLSASAEGRVTVAQLEKMKTLIAENGGDWNVFRTEVKQRHGVTIEYLDRARASFVIGELLAAARERPNNGTRQGAHP